MYMVHECILCMYVLCINMVRLSFFELYLVFNHNCLLNVHLLIINLINKFVIIILKNNILNEGL